MFWGKAPHGKVTNPRLPSRLSLLWIRTATKCWRPPTQLKGGQLEASECCLQHLETGWTDIEWICFLVQAGANCCQGLAADLWHLFSNFDSWKADQIRTGTGFEAASDTTVSLAHAEDELRVVGRCATTERSLLRGSLMVAGHNFFWMWFLKQKHIFSFFWLPIFCWIWFESDFFDSESWFSENHRAEDYGPRSWMKRPSKSPMQEHRSWPWHPTKLQMIQATLPWKKDEISIKKR